MKAVGHIALAIALVVLASTAPASADNQGGIKIGILNAPRCRVQASTS